MVMLAAADAVGVVVAALAVRGGRRCCWGAEGGSSCNTSSSPLFLFLFCSSSVFSLAKTRWTWLGRLLCCRPSTIPSTDKKPGKWVSMGKKKMVLFKTDWPGDHKNFMHMIQHGIVEDDSNRSPWETVRVCAKPIYESWESCRMSPVWRLLRFMGKGLVVAREGISTPNAPYLREGLLELSEQWQLVCFTCFCHWWRVNPRTITRKTSGRGGSEMASSLLPILASSDLQNTQKHKQIWQWRVMVVVVEEMGVVVRSKGKEEMAPEAEKGDHGSGMFIGSKREADGRGQLRWKVRGCLVVDGFCESGRRLAKEKGRSVKGSCYGADGVGIEAGKGKGRLCGDSEKEERVEVGGERPVFCLAKWGRPTGFKEIDF
ncbi:hypothetical protein NC651_001859 [Populus alba x Populus x berolinensis]|nr:hypothetical protein NC651_001859 [Populus alba x Populus x berolinensis]